MDSVLAELWILCESVRNRQAINFMLDILNVRVAYDMVYRDHMQIATNVNKANATMVNVQLDMQSIH